MVVFLAVMPVLYVYGLPTASVFVLKSNSMFPTLRQDDMVIVDSNVSFASLKIGDIIAFKTYGTDDSGQHETIVHRIAEIATYPSNGQRIIKTKGDANPGSVPGLDYPIFQQDYIGKVVYLVSPNLIVNTNDTTGQGNNTSIR